MEKPTIEDLTALLKKKEKEIKKLNTKVSSLEKGYKSKVSDLNESKAQCQELTKFVEYLFPEDKLSQTKNEKGYSVTLLKNIWITQVSNNEQQEMYLLKEERDALRMRQESYAMVENEYRVLKKVVDNWGGEDIVNVTIKKVDLLTEENKQLELQIKKLEEQVSLKEADKGQNLLNMMKQVSENADSEVTTTKTKQQLLEEISVLKNDYLKIKNQLEQSQHDREVLNETIEEIRMSTM